MGTFLLPSHFLPNKTTLVTYINMISNINSFRDRILLIPIKLDYEAIYSAYAAYSDPSSNINWVDYSSYYGTSFGPFFRMFFTDERIMETMMSDDALWNDHHHCSYLP